MNDEDASPRSDESPAAHSRWAVAPGSSQSGAPTSPGKSQPDPSAAPTKPRTAKQIIADVQSRPYQEDQPTRLTIRRPGVPAATPTPRLERDYDPDAAKRVERKPHAPLADESTRVTPELGEKRELKAVWAERGGPVMAGFGGVLLIIVCTLIGGIIDFIFADRAGIATTIGLVLSAAVAALITRKRDLLSVMVAPPLVYTVIAFLVLLVSSRPLRITSLADMAIRGFPAMALATGIAALIGGVRLFNSKAGERG